MKTITKISNTYEFDNSDIKSLIEEYLLKTKTINADETLEIDCIVIDSYDGEVIFEVTSNTKKELSPIIKRTKKLKK